MGTAPRAVSQYGPPPGGGYGPQPGYGTPGGGYPPAGYAGAPAYGGAGFAPPPLLSIGDALSYGWTRFSKNALNWILLLLAILVAFAVVGGLLFAVLLLPSASSSSDSALAVSLFSIGMVVFLLAILALAFLSSVVTTQGGLREIDGAKPAFGDFFRFQNLGGALLAAVLVGVLTWVGSLLCYLPGLIVAFFGMFTVPFAIDRGMNAWTALQSSFSLVSANIGPVFLLYLALAALNWVGSIPFGLGLLVTVPMTTIALMFAFRRLTGGPIAPLTGVTERARGHLGVSARLRLRVDPRLLALLGRDRRGGIGQRVDAAARLRERDHLTDGFHPGEQRGHPVPAERDAAVRGCAERERVEQEAELLLCLLVRDAHHREHAFLHVAAVDTDAAAADFVAVAHDVVGVGQRRTGFGVERVHRFRLR